MKRHIPKLFYYLFFLLIVSLFWVTVPSAGTYVYETQEASGKTIKTKAPAPLNDNKKNTPQQTRQAPAGKPYDHKKNKKGPDRQK